MKPQENTVLGLDIGSSSVGWALIRTESDGGMHIMGAGVRVFPMGVDENTLESRNTERRTARARRRLLDRRKRRLMVVARLLQRHGFLPKGKPNHDEPLWKDVLHINPYEARAAALDRKLEPFEFGRAVYHIAHRRGFCSARKHPLSDEEAGIVLTAIKQLNDEIQQAGSRTLGEYLYKLNPHDQRLRERYTDRQQYQYEFRTICEKQMQFGFPLTEQVRDALFKAIFFQRKPKWNRNTIGRCRFEKKRLRAIAAWPECQEFRILQTVNNLRIVTLDGGSRELTPNERFLLIGKLMNVDSLTFPEIRKLLNLPRGTGFNLQEGDNKELPGHTTNARIRSVIGTKWDNACQETRNAIVEALVSIEDPDVIKALALRKGWANNESEAEGLADVSLELHRMDLSRRAIQRLLPLLRDGKSYTEAVNSVYPEQGDAQEHDRLPPVENVRNPIVQRALKETRRVMNAIVRRWGVPGQIHIELARDLKQSREKRKAMIKRMRERESLRCKAAQKIMEEVHIKNPTRRDIEKALLWEECRGRCPYTGEHISFSDLFGDAPQYDIEHIIPWSRSLDDSFANKTLCKVQENRSRKRDKTPFEAYGNDKVRYEEILGHVRKFIGGYRDEKLRRFTLQTPEGPESALPIFTGAQLHATAHAARYAASYLGLLYPANERKSRIQVSAGRTTAYLRRAWDLNKLLGLANKKNRSDHRHHALDALVVALTTPTIVRKLTDAAQNATRPGTFLGFDPPTNLVQQAENMLKHITVSHRVNRRVNGQLHEETFYGMITLNGQPCAVVRKRLDALSSNDIAKIVDPAIQSIIRNVLQGADPKKVFQDPARWPVYTTKQGRKMRIRRVRVKVDGTPIDLVPGDKQRRVFTGGNHHLEVFQVPSKKGKTKWVCAIVSRLEAMKRARDGQPVVPRTDDHGNPLLFSLAIGDTVKLQWRGNSIIAVVQKLSAKEFVFREHNDGRRAVDIPLKERIRIVSAKGLEKCRCEKLAVDPLGTYHVAHD